MPASETARQVADLFWIVLGIAGVVFVVVEGLLVFAIVRYRRRYDDEMPEQIHGNSTLEMIWTVIPALIMVALFGLTLNQLNKERNAPPDSYVIEVTGHQWYWVFSYPETNITLDSRTDDLVIPANEPVQFEVRSNDVIHSFWVPQLSGKADAIPGHTTTVWFDADAGSYAGECAEYCGQSHYAMLFTVDVKPRAEFDSWMQQQIEYASQFHPVGADLSVILPEGDPASGEALFSQMGCNSCHSLDGSVIVGPSLKGIGQRAATRISGYTAEQYIHESIVLPCDYVVEGFTCLMPQDFGNRLDAQGLADLISFLEQQ